MRAVGLGTRTLGFPLFGLAAGLIRKLPNDLCGFKRYADFGEWKNRIQASRLGNQTGGAWLSVSLCRSRSELPGEMFHKVGSIGSSVTRSQTHSIFLLPFDLQG